MQARILILSPRLELFFALAAVLARQSDPQPDGVRRWLDQARRKLDHGFRRRLGDQAGSPATWRRLAALPLPASPDTDGVIEALAALPPDRFKMDTDPEALQHLIVDALRRFDRLAFAAYWRNWREELAGDLFRLEARILEIPIPARASTATFLPSRFAPQDLAVSVKADDAVLLPFDPARLPSPSTARIATAGAPASGDPALVFRALGDATRYTVAGMIAREPLTSAELARRLGISNPTMAHHLRALRAAGLVQEETRGTRIVLALNRAALENLSAATVAQLFGAAAAPIRRSRRA